MEKNKFKDIFTGFQIQSLEEMIKLNKNQQISDKEMGLFRVVCENAVNSIHKTIDALHAEKTISESDFQWMLNLYFSICLQELYDLLQSIERENNSSDLTGNLIKNSIDKKTEVVMESFNRVIGGADVGKYSRLALDLIKSNDTGSKSYEDYILSRIIGVIIIMFREHEVNFDAKPPSDLPVIANKIWEDSFHNFVNNCASKK